jgi:hypothetical protein
MDLTYAFAYNSRPNSGSHVAEMFEEVLHEGNVGPLSVVPYLDLDRSLNLRSGSQNVRPMIGFAFATTGRGM